MAELTNGDVVGVSRHPGGPALTVSHDGASSFGSMRTVSEIMTPSCQTSILNAGGTQSDRLLMSAPLSAKSRVNMTLSEGTSTGGWKTLVQLSPTAAAQGGYSALAQLSTGDVLCMWEGPCAESHGSQFCLATVRLLPPKVENQPSIPGAYMQSIKTDNFKSDDAAGGDDDAMPVSASNRHLLPRPPYRS